MKKFSLRSCFLFASALLTLIGLIFLLIANHGAYPLVGLGWIITLSILSIVFALAVPFAEKFNLHPILVDLGTWLSLLCVAIALAISIYGRAELMGFVWFSNLMSGNKIARTALNLALVGWIFDLLSALLLIVSSALSEKKAEVKAETNI